MLHTHQVNPDVAEYIVRFRIALKRCSNVTGIEAKVLFEKNLWAEIAVQIINCYLLSLKYSQAAAQRAWSILKHAGIFEHTKRK